ncbi:MAG: hypothetical protein QM638_14355 [Nocardioides sp.]|uniref:hypothetical protein n=1 Tax=Nocardioides sp. TaxID=35761 RepID=UPI0039E4F6DB
MTTTAQDVLARHFPGLSPEQVDAELSRTPAAGATPISAAALRFLTEHGGEEARAALDEYDETVVQQNRAIAAARTLEELLATSLTIEEAATSLGLSRSRISHRLRGQSLYAFTIQGRRYLPRWQFRADPGGVVSDVIPGLAEIVPAIPRDMHPLAVKSFMTEPLEDLGDRSPVDHLCSYGVVEVVADRLVALGHW